MLQRTAAVLLPGALAFSCWLFWPQPAIAPTDAPPPAAGISPARVDRGARVVALGDCMVCHTAANGAPYAGGLPLQTPFGAIYSTNITPDPETGIGRWSYAAFERALRHGVARDGHLLYPAFPYTHYTQMTDDDIHAAYDYLMTRTPVRAEPPKNDLVFPLGFRPLLAGWNLLFLRPGNRIAVQDQQVLAERGKYLVNSLGHCASCHSGLNLLGGEKSPAFGGGTVDGWHAPSLIHLASASVPWSENDLFDYLRTGMSRAHGAAKGPMQPVVAHLAEVPAEDVRAIAAYISQIQVAGKPAGLARKPEESADADQRQLGAVLFASACASCHGPGAPMMTVSRYPGLNISPAVLGRQPTNFLQTVLHGVPLKNAPASIYMPAFADMLNDQQIASLAAYVRADLAQQPAWQHVASQSKTIRESK